MTKRTVFFYIAFVFTMAHVPIQKAMGQGFFSPKNRINRYTSVGIGFGSAHSYGDLSSPNIKYFHYGLYTNVRFNINAHYTKHLNPNTAIRLQLAWVRLYGDDFTYSQRNLDKFYNNYIRNLNFVNDVKELTISGIFNLIPTYDKGSRGRLAFTPYATIGLGLIAHSPKTWHRNGSFVKKMSLKNAATNGNVIAGSNTESYSLITGVLPFGLGLRWKVNKSMDVSLEGNIRISGTKYLDDIYRDPYPNQITLATLIGPESASLSKRIDEPVHAKSGKDRTATLSQIYTQYIVPVQGSTYTDAIDYYENTSLNRGSFQYNDIYATTQITVSYIISDFIKCP